MTRRCVAGAVGTLGVAALALAACSAAPEVSQVPGTTVATQATEEASPVASASATDPATSRPDSTDGVTSAALEVDWTVPFTLTAPSDWTTEVSENVGASNADTQWLATGDRHIAFTRTGPDSVDDWLAAVATAEQLVASEPIATEIGGMSGYRVDLEVSEQASADRCFNEGRCYTLFQDASGYWPVEEGRPTALWLIDVDGETVAIATDSRAATFDDWAASVEEILATLEWRD